MKRILIAMTLLLVSGIARAEGPALRSLKAAAGNAPAVFDNDTRAASDPALTAGAFSQRPRGWVLASWKAYSPAKGRPEKAPPPVRTQELPFHQAGPNLQMVAAIVFATLLVGGGGWAGALAGIALAPAHPVLAGIIGGYIGALAGAGLFQIIGEAVK